MTEDRVWLITISAALSYILAATILHCQLDVSDVLRQFDVVERKIEFRCNNLTKQQYTGSNYRYEQSALGNVIAQSP